MKQTKTCSKCKQEAHISMFSRDSKSSDKLKSQCKKCAKDSFKKYYNLNKEKMIHRAIVYYHNNTDKCNARAKAYYANNKTEIIRRTVANYKQSLANSELARLKHNLRTRTSHAFSRKIKGKKTEEMLGTSYENAKAYIEKMFQQGMTWDNYGSWHIDHIVPLASASTCLELEKLCHYTNLQPLWAIDNIRKGAKISD